MSEKPSPPKTMRGFAADSMSSANFQALRAKGKVAGTPPSSTNSDTSVTRADSMSSANFQALGAKTKPVAPGVSSAGTKPAESVTSRR